MMTTSFPPAPRRTIVSWCLYDFANSIYAAVIPATVWSAYYAGTIVGEAGLGAQWWGRAISLTMVLVAISSPFMGAVADFAGRRKRLLLLYTAVSVVATALMATVAPGMIRYGFAISVCAGFGFEGAMVFYNSFLPGLAPPEKQGRLSGAGFAVGYAGSAFGLLAVLPLVNRGAFGAAFCVVAAWFIVFAIPAFVWLPRDAAAQLTVVQAGAAGWRGTRETAREILRTPILRQFFAAYFLYIDAVNTVIVFSSIFAAQVLGFSMSELILVYLCVQLSALAGAALWAKPTDIKGPKFVIVATVCQWIVVVILVYFVQSKTVFFVIAALAGTGLGAIQSASRTFMTGLLPRGREGEFFGFYSLCGKGAAVMGPLLFGEVAGLTGDLRAAALSILVFFVIGGILIATVKAGGPTVKSS